MYGLRIGGRKSRGSVVVAGRSGKQSRPKRHLTDGNVRFCNIASLQFLCYYSICAS
jgi:hypothetical protein